MKYSETKVLVVEDESDVRELVKLHLIREGFSVDVSSDGEEAISMVSKNQYQLIILDWMLPSLSGLDVCREIRKKHGQKIPVLMLTARADTLDKVVGLEVGADDYLTKPFEIRELMARAKALVRRSSLQVDMGADQKDTLPDSVLKHGPFELRVAERKFLLEGAEVSLTAGEMKMMQLFIEHKGKSLERDWLIKNIQGEEITVVDRAIDTRILGLRKKLGNASDWIETVRGHGYRLRVE